ncbi:hypothetical protein [Thermoanaerobacterium thermosaccharolyticum]|uniref:hypothetical protein n=1 Tax=Thermoanaerobacterium thermosaccharolyticum TaxID=1517 RepID=UPI003DA87ABB
MKTFLLYKNRDFDMKQDLHWNEQMLVQDLGLNAVFDAMAQGDEFLYDVAYKVILTSLNDVDEIIYRQDILKDCLKHPSIIRSIYDIAVETLEMRRKIFGASLVAIRLQFCTAQLNLCICMWICL